MIGYNEYGGPLNRFGSRLVNGLYSQLARYIIRFTELYTSYGININWISPKTEYVLNIITSWNINYPLLQTCYHQLDKCLGVYMYVRATIDC